MKICIISNGIVPPEHYGGTERVIDWLTRELAAMGQTVYFIGPPGSKVASAEKSVLIDFSALDEKSVHPEIRGAVPPDTDIVHDHAFYGDYGRPTVKTMHGLPEGVEDFGPEFSFVSNSHRLACGCPSNPFVYNGIDPDDYLFSAKKEDYFLFLGKVDWEVKGLSVAMGIAKSKKLKLVIAGDFIDPAFYREKLKRELTADIRYIGPVGGEDKRKLLSGARALIFPTLWPEPFGLVAVEAMASGTPVLSTYNGAMCEIMVNGVTGYLCETVSEMESGVDLLRRIDPEACRARVRDNFSARIMAQRYLRLYQQTIRAFHAGSGTAGNASPTACKGRSLEDWLEIINRHIVNEKIDDAVLSVERMLQSHPHYYQGYSYLYHLLTISGDRQKAEKVVTLLNSYRDDIAGVLENACNSSLTAHETHRH
jgi:glycosyltransferase involved in cell wall biosynthesis